jgi:hypothetical protein
MPELLEQPTEAEAQPNISLAARFMRRFAGFDRAYGTYRIETTEASGKNTGKAATRRGAVTEDLWQSHLAGVEAIGIVPIRSDCACWFGAIDIDTYKNFDLAKLARDLARLRLPLVVCRSKSGGAHCYLFATSPIPAAAMQDRLREILQIMGLSKRTEIFPKQREIQADKGDIGGWINMPYFDAANTTRYAYDAEGNQLVAEAFLEYADWAAQDAEWFTSELKVQGSMDANQWFPEGPPCLQQLAREGIPEGTRNNALLNIGRYYRMVDPNALKENLGRANAELCSPPLEASELNGTILRSITKNSLRYQCNKEPLESRCNSAVCRGRRYGVGRDGKQGNGVPDAAEIPNESDVPIIGQLRKYNSDPPIWFLDVNDINVQLTTDQLMSPRAFAKRVYEATNFVMDQWTERSWTKMLRDVSKDLIEIEPDPNIGPDALLRRNIEYFLRKYSANVPDRNAVRTNMVWTERDRMWFDPRSLIRHLKMLRVDYPKGAGFQYFLQQKMGGIVEQWTIQSAEYDVVGVPALSAMTPLPINPTEETVL